MNLELIGRNIRRLRGYYSMSQQKLADKAGISRYQVTRIENGATRVTLETIHQICLALNVSLETLENELPDIIQ